MRRVGGYPVVGKVSVGGHDVVRGGEDPGLDSMRPQRSNTRAELAHAGGGIGFDFGCSPRGGVAVVVSCTVFVKRDVNGSDHEQATGGLKGGRSERALRLQVLQDVSQAIAGH